MISVGIDVSKGKSTVCILKLYGEILQTPFEIHHTKDDLDNLLDYLNSLKEEFRVVLESTGHYHMSLLKYFHSKGIFVSLVNPIVINKFSNTQIRKGKTDKKDSIKIAEYGLIYWHKLNKYQEDNSVYSELKCLSRQYYQYLNLRIGAKINFINILDNAMPDIIKHLDGQKLYDFTKKYWHYDNISSKSFNQFDKTFKTFIKKKGYRYSLDKSKKIYHLAKISIPIYDSKFPSTKSLVLESVHLLEEISVSSNSILAQMQTLAKSLKEYNTVREMNGVGDKLSVRLIAEIGDVRRFYSGKALIAYAGIDAPPHQSGTFYGTKRKISKRGSKYLRKTGFEIMQALTRNKPTDDNSVYQFILKKESEGKPKRVAKIAGLNKFLRIYYARVNECYSD
jgi:transposase